jgi:hypothetical protein
MLRCNETARGELRFASFGLNQRQSGSYDEEGSAQDKAMEVAACSFWASESHGEFCDIAPGTPWL